MPGETNSGVAIEIPQIFAGSRVAGKGTVAGCEKGVQSCRCSYLDNILGMRIVGEEEVMSEVEYHTQLPV